MAGEPCRQRAPIVKIVAPESPAFQLALHGALDLSEILSGEEGIRDQDCVRQFVEGCRHWFVWDRRKLALLSSHDKAR